MAAGIRNSKLMLACISDEVRLCSQVTCDSIEVLKISSVHHKPYSYMSVWATPYSGKALSNHFS